MRLITATLGCKVNQYETEYMRESLHRIGYDDGTPDESADLIIINTCTVTSESDLKSRKLIRRLIRQHPNAEVVVMGCYATRAKEKLLQWPQVSEIITDKRQIGDFLRRRGITDLPDGITTFAERHRAYVKIQDGCRVGCSYCIIPKVRPYLSSRPGPEIIDEIKRLIDSGYREMVLTGIHLGHYGVDFQRNNSSGIEQKTPLADNLRLSELVARIVAIDAPFRLRLSSMEAVEVSDALIDLIRENPKKICPHLHLSMQSGSDSVLQRMCRRWLSRPFFERCEQIKQTIPNMAVTTDVIVGFPGESDREFEETCEMVERIQFAKVHVFPFSPREGTEAATMPDQIPSSVKEARVSHLLTIAEKLRADFATTRIGNISQVLLETPLKKNKSLSSSTSNTLSLFDIGNVHKDASSDLTWPQLIGTSDHYLRVVVNAPLTLIGELVDVSITAANNDELVGTLV